MENKLAFISSPYSHKKKKVVKERYNEVLKFVADLMNNGEFVFSPIVHCHELANKHKLPGDWQYWGGYCEIMLQRSQVMYVLTLDGWEDSAGVKAEIELAKRFNIPIHMVGVNTSVG